MRNVSELWATNTLVLIPVIRSPKCLRIESILRAVREGSSSAWMLHVELKARFDSVALFPMHTAQHYFRCTHKFLEHPRTTEQ